MYSVDVIIPTYKPGKKLLRILEALKEQTYPVTQVILVNTEKSFYEEFAANNPEISRYTNLVVRHITKQEFDHGGTRHLATTMSKSDIFVCMTDDAVPADGKLIEKLIEGLEKEHVAVSYARQLANKDCSVVESYTRSFNYPEEDVVKAAEDIPRLGIKTFFCSNVCAAYWHSIYEELGGFVRHTIFNEDMIYAAGAIKKGYRIAYCAKALVYHSHNYKGKEQFHRNFDLGVSQAQHPEVFAEISSEGEGKRLVKDTTNYLKKNHLKRKIPGFYWNCGCKLIGYRLGKKYMSLPMGMVRKFSMNREYWKSEKQV